MKKNNTIFIINETIEYNTEKGTLKNTITGKEIRLNSSANNCLFLILSKKDETIFHDIFLKLIWEKNGEFVGLNTLYQNISIIRRSFKQLDVNDNLIITVPKKGFRFSGDLDVKIINHKKIEDIGANGISLKCKLKKNILDKKKFLIFFFVSIILIIFIIQPILYKKNIISSYVKESNISECYVFSKIKKDDRVNIETILTNAGISCLDKKYIYISNKPYSNNYSIIECNKSFDEKGKNFCDTYLYEK